MKVKRACQPCWWRIGGNCAPHHLSAAALFALLLFYSMIQEHSVEKEVCFRYHGKRSPTGRLRVTFSETAMIGRCYATPGHKSQSLCCRLGLEQSKGISCTAALLSMSVSTTHEANACSAQEYKSAASRLWQNRRVPPVHCT